MKHDTIKNLREMTLEQLQQYVEDTRRTLFSLRLNSATSHIKDFSQFKKLRHEIARGLTVLGAMQGGLTKK